MVGEALDGFPPERAIAYDLTPGSVTFYGGPFGRIPLVVTNAMLVEAAQTQAAADAKLLEAKGLPYSVDFTQVPNPALEPYDSVRVTYPPVQGQNPQVRVEKHVLEQVVIGLGYDQGMPCTTKLTTNEGA